MIIVTGAAGFIGSVLIGRLNEDNFNDVIAVDDFSGSEKLKNLQGKKVTARIDRAKFFNWLKNNHKLVQFVFHIGARTDTAEYDIALLNELNLHYSQQVWEACAEYGIPMVYASSAATYGAGELGYDDDHALVPKLQPLNPYGISKNEFDKWALKQQKAPYYWVGLKFFNVYGPNEYHKGRMASVVFHAFRQISDSGKMKLFRSHNAAYPDGGQMRDFVYVKDVAEVLIFLMHSRKAENNGIYNLGSGSARTFLDLAHSTFHALGKAPEIEFIDTPEDIRDKYQYFTRANMAKLHHIGYGKPFHALEEGIEDYVKNYLAEGKYY